ncbi:MAG: LysR family transcriptional regulator [Vagococcus sp.]
MLDYRYETFITLVETKSYTKTAKKINFTQPAVTKHIQHIEKDLNTTLVIFKDRKLIITKEGLYLYEKIKDLQDNISTIKSHLNNHTSLKIGTSKTIGEFVIPIKINAFNQEYPKASISLMVDNTTSLLRLLRTRKIDMALVSGPVSDNQYIKQSFMSDNIILICSPTHPLANRVVAFEDILNETLIVREPGSGLTEALEIEWEKHGFSSMPFHHVQTVGHINLIKNLIQNGEGVSFIYQLSVEEAIKKNNLAQIRLVDFAPTQDFYVVRNASQELNKSDTQFIKLLQQEKNS